MSDFVLLVDAIFPLGMVVVTPGAIDAMGRQSIAPATLLQRHVSGDWGDLCAEDRHKNDRALKRGGRILSRYQLADSTFYVITEADRSVTTMLLPSEY